MKDLKYKILQYLIYVPLGVPYLIGRFICELIPCAGCHRMFNNSTIIDNKHYCNNCEIEAFREHKRKIEGKRKK